ncbi:amidase signature domain-containing protein [Dactylonectria macrodidyma]|uniref:Amidase signature domain-containing protein n=1 Tax=Dactylonectria macrodidyma TaxID=307937 RepID=A0A9P9FPP9_9HYPO|nr:amidase signature domain-containing protein [Dactylonectria macrodidyma]
MQILIGESPGPVGASPMAAAGAADMRTAETAVAAAARIETIPQVENAIELQGISYRWSSDAIAQFCLPEEHTLNPQFGPCVVVVQATSCPDFSDAALAQTLALWLATDDVFCSSFCTTVVCVTAATGRETQLIYSLLKSFPALKDLGVQQIVKILPGDDFRGLQNLCSGPYVWRDACFYQIYRLYPGTQSAFLSSIVQSTCNGHHFIETYPTTHVAVPSRIHFGPPSHHRPLAGLRFGLKDLFDVAGLKTSAGSRAYYDLCSEIKETAPLVEMLLRLGAVLIGKTKLTQFANGEDPQEWIDYTCPWNPRGDGYQNPDTSSSGSASAVSSYDWVDFAVGSDTCGSIACPAAAQGIFAIRFTQGALPREGVFRLNEDAYSIYIQVCHLDSVGFFARDVELLSHITSHWLSANGGVHDQSDCNLSVPTDVIYPWSSFPHQAPDTLDTHDRFVASLAEFTKGARIELDIDDKWKQTCPLGSGLSIYDDLSKTTAHLHLAGFSDAVKPFREEYWRKFGKDPYLDRVNGEKMRVAETSLTPDIRHEMVQQKDAFSRFVREKLIKSAGKASDTFAAVMVWPFNPQEPQYRDAYPPLTPHVNWRWDVDYTAPLAGLPQVIVPIGQYEYKSRITGNTEYLPICASVVGPAGSDIALVQLLSRFLQGSKVWPVAVKSGRYI